MNLLLFVKVACVLLKIGYLQNAYNIIIILIITAKESKKKKKDRNKIYEFDCCCFLMILSLISFL